MKILFIILMVTTVSKLFGQANFNSILKNVQMMRLPYTTEQGNSIAKAKKKVLNTTDSLFMITRLNSKLPRKISPYGDSAFGQIDCEDTLNCQKLKEIKEIAILSLIKVNTENYLLHLEFEEKEETGKTFGALVSINSNGKLIDWFFSNENLNGGNPHGNVARDFTIQKDKTIFINETSWGDNTVTYGFKAKFKIASNENIRGYSNGEFELKNLCIDY